MTFGSEHMPLSSNLASRLLMVTPKGVGQPRMACTMERGAPSVLPVACHSGRHEQSHRHLVEIEPRIPRRLFQEVDGVLHQPRNAAMVARRADDESIRLAHRVDQERLVLIARGLPARDGASELRAGAHAKGARRAQLVIDDTRLGRGLQ